MKFSRARIKDIFSDPDAEKDSSQPIPSGTLDLTEFGRHHGFLKAKEPKVISVFVTKGGVLKSTVTLNLARLLALHGIRTLVIGLDMQCDISRCLGVFDGAENEGNTSDLESRLAELDSIKGLYHFFSGKANLTDCIQPTDLPSLFVLAETPELATLERSLGLKPRREYWLKESVIEPLLNSYQVILLDCAPSWSQLTTNALVASDVLVSPLECKINNFRNFQMFDELIREFQMDLKHTVQHHYLPTRYSAQRRLSQDILTWYQAHIPNCLDFFIKESVRGEEASALNLSQVEMDPRDSNSIAFKKLAKAILSLPNPEAMQC